MQQGFDKDVVAGLVTPILLIGLFMSTKSLNGASISPIILSILKNGDSYGYDIIQQVKERTGGQLEWAAGSLYPVMHRMQTNGWITDYWFEPEGERRRRYYSITSKGLKALTSQRKNWMMFHNLLADLWSETRGENGGETQGEVEWS